jgi:hypothetical protein
MFLIKRMSLRRRTLPWLVTLPVLVFLVAAGTNHAAAEEIDWKIGLEFRKALDQRVGLKWGENPIREALHNLARNQRTAIWLDRRVDPGRKLEFESQGLPLGITLDQLCERYRMGKSIITPVIYIGPAATAEKLATVAAVRRQQVGRHSPTARAKWARAVAWHIPQLSEPRALFQELVRESGSTPQNPEAIPHDLWPEISLPPLSLADRMTLVLAGFDLTFEQSPDGSTIRIVPMPDKVEYEQIYSWRDNNGSLAAQLREKFPEVKIALIDGKVHVTGKYEYHELIDQLMSGETVRTAKVAPGDTRYTLRVDDQPAGAVVKTVANRLGKELVFAPELREKLSRNIKLDVKEATLDELLTKTLGPLELTYVIIEASLVILPAKP